MSDALGAEWMREKAAMVLDRKHLIYMTSKGRNPMEYQSEFSLIAKSILAIPAPTDADLDAAALARPVVRALVEAAEMLISIVEGIQGAMEHGMWWNQKGAVRLKDTNEWVAFYNARAAIAKAKEAGHE